MSRDGILEGDRVNVHFEYVDSEFNVLIKHKPTATGDCFYVERKDGTQVAIQNYSKMVKLEGNDE
jgi:hypothetical protein